MSRKLFCVLVSLFLALSVWGKDPDILLISLDTFRADRLAPWGGRPELAPNLNALAARGSAFTACWTPAPITLPAHATLLTGCLPDRTQLHDNGIGTLSKDVPTLAQALASRGYRTSAVVASRLVSARFGLSRGFALYDDGVGPTGVRTATHVTNRALSIVRAQDPKPFFLWAHYYDTHEPYEAPESFAYRAKGSPYNAAVSYVDSEVGRLLKAVPQGTLVLVVSDHGESLGEHGEPTHGVLLCESTVRAVLILAGPGTNPGTLASEPCSLADVAPTVLGILGGPKANYAAEGLDLRAKKEAVDRLRILSLETWLPFNSFGWSPLAGVTNRALQVDSRKARRALRPRDGSF